MQNARAIKLLARAGYAARGAVYLIIGGFAVAAAMVGGDNRDPKDAIREITSTQFGAILIWAAVVGLIGYTLWRCIQSIFDTDNHGWSLSGIGVRFGLLCSAATYGSLAFYAISLNFAGASGSGGGGAAAHLAKFVGSTAAMAVMALAFAIVACAHWVKALSQKYVRHFRPPPNAWPIVHAVAVAGLTARGLVLAVLSFLLGRRLLSVAPGSVSGTPNIADALTFVRELSYGESLLIGMGVGIVLFGVYSILEAAWRVIRIEEVATDGTEWAKALRRRA